MIEPVATHHSTAEVNQTDAAQLWRNRALDLLSATRGLMRSGFDLREAQRMALDLTLEILRIIRSARR